MEGEAMEMSDGGVPFTGLTDTEKAEKERNAFQFQAEMIALDEVFAQQPPIEADAMVALWDYNEDADENGYKTYKITSGESLVPHRVTLDGGGRLTYLFKYHDDGLDETVVLNVSLGDLKDIGPELYDVLNKEVQYASLASFTNRNEVLIGSRKRVIATLKQAIRARSIVSARAEYEKEERQRLERYEQDDTSGMF